MPFLCNYYVTLRCNSRCEFCNIWSQSGNARMPEHGLEDMGANLRDLRRLGVRMIDLTGGEPLLYPHIIEALRLCKKHGFITTMTTNCMLYPKFASELKGLVDILHFSLESADEATHNRIRGSESHSRVVESISIAKELRQRVLLIHTVTDANVDRLDEMVSFAQGSRCTLLLNPCFSYFGNASLSKEKASELRKHHGKPYVVMDLAYLRFMEEGGNDTADHACRAVSSAVTILPDNSLVLPCFHHPMKKLSIDGDLFGLYRSEAVGELKAKEGRLPFCDGCLINCCMRVSLPRRYPILSMRSGARYLRERLRDQF